jgi:hypothetical protein
VHDDLLEFLGVASRPCACTEKVKSTFSGIGSTPTRPPANCEFCARTAPITSDAARPSCDSLSGCIQMRIEYSWPHICASPTPGTRPDFIEDVQRGVIGQRQRTLTAVRRIHRNHLQDAGGRFAHHDALAGALLQAGAAPAAWMRLFTLMRREIGIRADRET